MKGQLPINSSTENSQMPSVYIHNPTIAKLCLTKCRQCDKRHFQLILPFVLQRFGGCVAVMSFVVRPFVDNILIFSPTIYIPNIYKYTKVSEKQLERLLVPYIY